MSELRDSNEPQASEPVVVSEPLSPSVSDTPFRWRDLLYIALFYLLVGGAITQLGIMAASSALHIEQGELKNFTVVYVSVAAITQALVSLATLGFLWLLVRSRGATPFWAALGWRALPPAASRAANAVMYLLLGVALLAAVQIAGNFLRMPSGVPLEDMFRDRPSVLITMALAILVAPWIEETLFRGCLYPVVARSFGMTAGVLATGIAFGSMHALQLGFAWQPVALLSFVGIVLTYVRARTGTVLASFLVHLGYNSSLFGAFYFATNGLRNFPGS